MKAYRFKSQVALMMLGAIFAACTEKEIVEPQQTNAPKTYTMTVSATKGGDDATTRALTLSADGKTLNATWTAGDKVTVYKNDGYATPLGTLVAQSSGASTTLSGTLTGDINVGEELVMDYLVYGNKENQDGTLETIAKKYDHAEAIVTVASNDDGNITTTGVANFESMGVIIRFTLKDSDGTPLNTTNLAVKIYTTKTTASLYHITAPSARSEFFVAVKSITNKSVTLNAYVGDKLYTYQKDGVTFNQGQYYTIGVKMSEFSGDLAFLSADYTAKDGDVLRGTLYKDIALNIADGATVTLDGVTINTSRDNGIVCLGDANIILADGSDNSVASKQAWHSCIQAGPEGTTLTISGSGSLTAAMNNNQGAAIGSGGGNSSIACGNITIAGGTINATGGPGGAGIGSGGNGTCGNITITGGTITATGGKYAAGIGCGNSGTCGTITIANTVTSVTATMGSRAICSIGKGYGSSSSCGTITIGGTEYPDGVTESPFTWPTPQDATDPTPSP